MIRHPNRSLKVLVILSVNFTWFTVKFPYWSSMHFTRFLYSIRVCNFQNYLVYFYMCNGLFKTNYFTVPRFATSPSYCRWRQTLDPKLQLSCKKIKSSSRTIFFNFLVWVALLGCFEKEARRVVENISWGCFLKIL